MVFDTDMLLPPPPAYSAVSLGCMSRAAAYASLTLVFQTEDIARKGGVQKKRAKTKGVKRTRKAKRSRAAGARKQRK
jgi:hypothetical protein